MTILVALRRASALVLLLLQGVLPAPLPAAPYLVKDLNTSPSPLLGQAFPKDLGTSAGVSYFAAGDPAHGIELWRSDGTPGGTERLTDICAGSCDSLPAAISIHAGRIYFKANDGFSGDELWVSDGTPGSERRVRDVCPGLCSAAPGRLAEVGGHLLFFAHFPADPDHFELWQTDGSRDGTVPVKALCPGSCAVTSDLISIGERALFLVNPLPWESELWVTDGTAAGTRFFRELGSALIPRWAYDNVVPGDGFAWVWASDGLWRTDGTAAGTFRLQGVEELSAERDDGHYLYHHALWHGLLFGVLSEGALIRSDGTAEGTFRIRDLYTGSFAALDSEVLFQVDTSPGESSLWSTRGTADTTAPRFDLSFLGNGKASSMVRLGGGRAGFLWVPTDAPDRTQLWVTDGTAAGTRQLAVPAGYLAANLGEESFFSTGDGRAFFFRELTEDHLWITDGTEAGTHRVRSFGDMTGSSGPFAQAALGRELVFSALGTNESLSSLFASDGTAAGTRLLSKDAASASSFFRFGDQLLLSAGTHEATWVTDGSPDGTSRVKNIPFAHPALLGGQILFSGSSNSSGTELWKIDRLGQPVDLLKDIDPFHVDTAPGNYESCEGESSLPVPGGIVGGRLLLAADDGRSGRELWATDGTRAGTLLLRDINLGRKPGVPEPCYEGPSSPHRHDTGLASNPEGLVLLGSVVLFTADDGLRGRELWVSNGTSSGTHRVADLAPAPAAPRRTTSCASTTRVYFLAANSASMANRSGGPTAPPRDHPRARPHRRRPALLGPRPHRRRRAGSSSPSTTRPPEPSCGRAPATPPRQAGSPTESRPRQLFPAIPDRRRRLLLFAADDGLTASRPGGATAPPQGPPGGRHRPRPRRLLSRPLHRPAKRRHDRSRRRGARPRAVGDPADRYRPAGIGAPWASATAKPITASPGLGLRSPGPSGTYGRPLTGPSTYPTETVTYKPPARGPSRMSNQMRFQWLTPPDVRFHSVIPFSDKH